jgi:hypothetical protein
MPRSNSDSDLITDLPVNIGNPARDALSVAGITRLKQLTEISEKELLKLHGVGPKAVRLLREALSMRGLAFAPPDRATTVSEPANRRIPRRASKRIS